MVEEAIAVTKASNNDRPKFIKYNTVNWKGMEETKGTNTAHGEAGVPYIDKVSASITPSASISSRGLMPSNK